MKCSIKPRVIPPTRYPKSICARRHGINNAILETLSHKTYQTVFVPNKSRILLISKFSTWGITRQYEEEQEEQEEQGPVWHVIDKTDYETKNDQPSDPVPQPPKKHDTVAVADHIIEEETNSVDSEVTQAIISPTETKTVSRATFKSQVKWNRDINSLIQASQFPQALKMIDTAIQTNFPLNLINWNTIAKCYSRLNRVDQLYKVIKDMKLRGVQPNAITFNIIIDTCGKRKDLKEMSRFFAKMLQEGVQPTISTFTSMMHTYSRCDMTREALLLFNQMPDYGIQPNQDCCMLVIRILAKNNDFEKVQAVLQLFESNGWNLESNALFSIIESYANLGDVEKCIKYFEMRHRLLQGTDLGLWTKMLQILAQQGTMEQFWKYYLEARAELPRCDSVFYTAILGPLLKRDQMQIFWKVAVDLNRDTEMGPNQTTWWSVALMDVYMRGCIKAQKFEEVPTILKRMQQFGLKPDLDMLSGMGSTGCESLEGEKFHNFVKLYARVAATYVRYKAHQDDKQQ